MKRADFLHKSIRYLLLLVLAAIAVVLGKKANIADCSGCPEIASCNKEACLK